MGKELNRHFTKQAKQIASNIWKCTLFIILQGNAKSPMCYTTT